MKTKDFNNKLTSSKLRENMNKMFGMNVKLESYSREQLEDMRNKIRTRMFQQEGQAGYNDLLTQETYQQDKAMLALLNTRINEMLGEDIGKLRDKLKTLEEAKKGVRAPKYAKKAKGSKGADDKDGDGKKDFDDIQIARMTAGGVPKKKAVAKATSDNFKEDTDKEKHDYYFGKDKPKSEVGKSKELSKHTATTTGSGTKYTKRDLPGQDTADDADEKARKRKEKKMKEEKFDPLKHVKDPTPGEKKAAKDVKRSNYADRAALLKSAEKDGRLKESQQIFQRHVRIVNESLAALLQEDEEGKAKAITAAGDIVNDYTSWMQRVGQYQTKSMIELADAIRADFGAAEAEAFKQAVAPALSATLDTLMSQREAISNAVAVLAGEATPMEPMGAEPGIEPAGPDMMNEPSGDEFGAADAAAGAGTPGREMRESRFQQKLAESHSIMAKLSR